jgi:hypothetical protein
MERLGEQSGGGGGDAPADPWGEEDGITRTGPQGDRDRVEVAQMKAEMDLMITTIRELGAAHPRGEEDGITRTGPQGDRDRVKAAKMKVQMELMMNTIGELATAQGAGGRGPAHGQTPPEAAQGVWMTQNSQVLSRSPTSANIPNQTETILEAEVREQIRRTEAKRARMASEAAQGAIPRGMVGVPRGAAGGAVRGGGGGDAPADPRGDEDGITRPSPQGDRDRVEVAQITGPGKSCPKESPASRERSTAQGAGGMRPALGQEPPEAAQGVQTSQGAGGMGPAVQFSKRIFLYANTR